MRVPFEESEHRRLTVGEIKTLIRNTRGVDLVDGFLRPLEDGWAERQTWPIASFVNVKDAWRVDHGGHRAFTWLTHPVPEDLGSRRAAFVFPLASGLGVGYPEPSGWFELFVNGRLAVRFRETKYPELWRLGECSLYYDVKRSYVAPDGMELFLDPWSRGSRMASFGAAVLLVSADYLVPGREAKLTVRAGQHFPSHTWVRVDKCFDERFHSEPNIWAMVWEDALDAVLNGKPTPQTSRGNVYFGDIHTHSFCGIESPCGKWDAQERDTCWKCELDGRGNGCGWASVTSNYEYARDVANLDFFCLSEHDFQMPGDLWKRRIEAANLYNESGRFATLIGYEYTSWLYGHRNVYFRGDDPPMFPASPNQGGYAREPQTPPEELWRYLEDHAGEFITVPHHMTAAPHPFCWERFDPKYDVNVEIFSGWGSSETSDGTLVGEGSDKYPHLTIRNALRRGLRFGFVSGSDSHDGCPGNAQGNSIFNWANKYSKVGSGKTAVICQSLSRGDVFAAMKKRLCYATTGAPIILDVELNGNPMGSDCEIAGTRLLSCRVSAPSAVDRIYVVKNGVPVASEQYDSREAEFDFSDIKSGETDSYYVKVVLKDMETAWSSPIYVKR